MIWWRMRLAYFNFDSFEDMPTSNKFQGYVYNAMERRVKDTAKDLEEYLDDHK